MQKTLANTITTGMLLLCYSFLGAQSQSWKPAMDGIFPQQVGMTGTYFPINFWPNGPMGKDWIYGGYLDGDSLRRCVAYREGGRWKPLPFFGYYANVANDIIMYGDTLYIGGMFGDIVLEKDSSSLPNCHLLKWFNDSLWADTTIYGPMDMSVHGDTLLISGGSYYNPPEIIYTHFMTTDRGASWQYPYSIIHPTENSADFGATAKLEILDNGDILVINNGSPRGNPFSGLSRWDGQQWHSYGNGLFGGFSRTFDFEFYKGELYMGGTFNQYDDPQNPGNFIARWNGSQWENVANGTYGFVRDLFTHDDILYCSIGGGKDSDHRFGDAQIPYFAGWDGQQWCGTPFDFGRPPASFGFIKDTLYATFYGSTTVNGDSVSFMNYYDGDFLHGPNAICSTLGLGEEEVIADDVSLQIFPVPAKNEVQVVLPSSTIQYLKIYDLSGRCVLELHPEAEISETAVDVSGLVPDVYLLEVNGEYNGRFVKE